MNSIFTINITINPIGVFNGILSQTTNKGIANFNNLNINTKGTYNIIATSNHIITATSSTISIVEIVLSYIIITSLSSPSVFFEFSLEVQLLNQFSEY